MSNISLNNKRLQRASDNKRSKLEIFSYHVSTYIGNFFYKLGLCVAENPYKTITFSFIFVLISCIGFLNFFQERDPLKLWVPENSQFLKDTKFIINNFGQGIRAQSVLIVADDVLRPEVIQKLAVINKEFNEIEVKGEDGKDFNFEEICFKIPLIAAFTVGDSDDRRRKRDVFDDDFFKDDDDDSESKKKLKKILEPLLNIDMKQYCAIVDSLPLGCMRESVLELWKTNYEKIGNLTKQQIIEKLNETDISPETGHNAKFLSLLGGTETNSSGYITSAKSLLTSWMLHLNFSDVDSTKLGNIAGTEDWASYNSLAFEAKYLEIMQRLQKDLETDDIKIYYSAGRSFGDISSKTLFQDMDKIFLGAFLMMIYMIFVLSRFSWTEIRFTLTSAGLLNVGMAYVSGCGISSVFLFYSPVHTSLFFIILGLGVDDIFVIMAAMRKVKSESPEMKLTERIGKTLEKAGASITITSLTDIIAFLVGGTTVLPSLKSFCIFAALSILMTYVYVVTFFVAVLTLDEKRLARNRNGIVPCISNKEAKIWCEPKLMPRFIHFLYSKFILKKVGKVIVIVAAICLSAFSIDRVLQMKQKFDPIWFIPSSSYFFQYDMAHRHFYPNRGFSAGVYMGQLNYTSELPKIIAMSNEIENQTQILDQFSSWTETFREYVEEFYKIDITKEILTDAQFKLYISKFLFSSFGGQFQANFNFDKALVCGQPAGEIKISSITFNFHKFDNREEYLPAKRLIENIIRKANITTEPENIFLWGKIFGTWITDEIIDEEIFRNISLALVGVFVCTTIMIVNLQVCAYIFFCVLLSLVSVGGFMQMWGLSLDLITCISLQLSVGLCIDCAAHIGHTFLTISEGDGNHRALKTVEIIGAAVWQGGGSTLLAVSLLSFSDAYTFRTFFKVFTIVVIFALFYGTFLLPVILSIFSPKPYDIKNTNRGFSGKETELCDISRVEEHEFLKAKNGEMLNCDINENDKLNGNPK
ncbi:CLUMA_CG001509, isoform A [Clunio marinus]|uniref:CLUMA_CG001509, isoform A n=1 Tax=Clunio marinus TaxID=568069 RepID=A0A1J1HI55_9DIPT|nr:CLUMA_CG001509, isoform A [Clunio marinus]